MHHGYFKDRVSAYHDGDLRPEEMELMARHLEGCEECRKLLAELEKFDSLVEKHSGLAGDEYFEKSAQKIESLIAGQQKPEKVDVRRPFPRGLGWKVVAAAASFAVIGFIGLHQSDIMEQAQDRAVAPAERALVVSKVDTTGAESGATVPEEEVDALQSEVESGGGTAIESVISVTPEPTKEVQMAGEAGPTAITAADVGTRDRDVTTDQEREPDAGIVQPVDIPAEKTEAVKEEEAEGFSLKAAEATDKAERRDKKTKIQLVPPVDSPTAAVVFREGAVQVQGLMAESDDAGAGWGDSVSEGVRTLEEWRWTRDSCLGELDRLAGVGKGAKGIRLSEGDNVVKADLEKTLLEACYKTGLLTDDQSEFEKAVGYIRDYAGTEGAPHRELARQYLETLTSLKSKEGGPR